MTFWDVKAGPYGYVSAVNTNSAGSIVFSGFDVSGTGPGTDLHFLTINWRASGVGSSYVSLTVNTLVDASYQPVGNPTGLDCDVTVTAE